MFFSRFSDVLLVFRAPYLAHLHTFGAGQVRIAHLLHYSTRRDKVKYALLYSTLSISFTSRDVTLFIYHIVNIFILQSVTVVWICDALGNDNNSSNDFRLSRMLLTGVSFNGLMSSSYDGANVTDRIKNLRRAENKLKHEIK